MKQGDIVMIYEDPVTKEVEEGKVELIRLLHAGIRAERWKVRFLSDGYVCSRTIVL